MLTGARETVAQRGATDGRQVYGRAEEQTGRQGSRNHEGTHVEAACDRYGVRACVCVCVMCVWRQRADLRGVEILCVLVHTCVCFACS